MAAVANAPGPPTTSPRLTNYNDDDDSMSTIPDPRSRTISPTNAGGSPSSVPHHPDLSNEVATLSNKLINAINHQTNLDDTLSVTRHELETSRERIRQLELEAEEHADQIARGILIRSTVVQAERKRLLASLAEEKAQRAKAEKEKRRIEQELENLTAALFEEANKMVKTAREDASKDHEIIQRRNEQLKSQLADMETLLTSHQEQLAELKQVMEQMGSERDDQTNLTAPSTPGLSKFDSKDEVGDATLDSASGTTDLSPSYPTSFTHLLHPVLRTDLVAYDDFISLLRMSKKAGERSRASSGSYGSLGISLGSGSSTQSSSAAHQVPSNGSTSSLSTAATTGSSPITPITPASSASNGSNNNTSSTTTPLKETRFYKRALAEDIEPTLRLDAAPGLSWLARRSVLNAMYEGTLVVEPMPQTPAGKISIFACSLCGETRKDPAHTRTHRFRTSENDSAQRYPLCKYCLGRVRSSCDFLGFLRMLKDGHWRADDEESERAAWEGSVRLREQMFWCRMGGGVVPVGSINHAGQENDSRCPRVIDNERKESLDTIERTSEEIGGTGETSPRDTVLSDTANVENGANEECIVRREEKIRQTEGGESADGLLNMAKADALPSNSDFPDHHSKGAKSIHGMSGRSSASSLGIAPDSHEKSLSITIP